MYVVEYSECERTGIYVGWIGMHFNNSAPRGQTHIGILHEAIY